VKHRSAIYIDGTNLYSGQYELFGPNQYLNFNLLIKKIESSIRTKFDKIYFYASYSPKPRTLTQKQKNYLVNENLFYRSVRNTPRVSFFKGYRSKTSGKEKEVDVKLAVDIVHHSHLGLYDYIYLISGDADFMHALKIAKSNRIKIVILALQNRIPQRFVYFYLTLIFFFSKKLYETVTITQQQKVKKILLTNQEQLITSIKKNPEMQASRA
jgi:uncharacterized LabA/DUF88 family protein